MTSESDLDARISILEKENDKLRFIIADSDLDCIYCGLKKCEMLKCASGFPGCGRADDLMVPCFTKSV